MTFFKRHKILSGFLTLIGLFTIALIVYIISTRMNIPTERIYPSYLKGVWEPQPPVGMAGDMKRIKEDNINLISLGPAIHVPLLGAKTLYFEAIKTAKKEGLAVHIAPQAFGPNAPDPDAVDDETLEEYTAKVLEWAELSEKYGIEYFSPLNEADITLHTDRAIEWHNEVLPELRKVFSGKILAKWACNVNEETACREKIRASKDFDGVMIDIFPPNEKEALEQFYVDLEEIVRVTSEEAKQLGLTIVIGEFAIPVEKSKFTEAITPGAIVSEEEQAEFTSRYLDIVMPYYDGVIYCGWFLRDYGIKDRPVEQVIREKFAIE